jgi:hypothetical protein
MFTNWAKALLAAGLVKKCQVLGRPKVWDPGRIIRVIQQRQIAGQSLCPKRMHAENVTLLWAARRYFSSWEQALLAAGIDPESLSP